MRRLRICVEKSGFARLQTIICCEILFAWLFADVPTLPGDNNGDSDNGRIGGPGPDGGSGPVVVPSKRNPGMHKQTTHAVFTGD